MLLPDAAHAQEAAQCVDQHFRAQERREEGKLSEALTLLEECSAPGCPGPVKAECVEWLAQVQEDLPSIIVSVRAESGEDVVPEEVWIDSTAVTDQLGRAVSVNPGTRELRVRLPSGESYTHVFVACVGEKRRSVSVTVPGAAAGQERGTRHFTWPVAVWAGVGVAGFVGLGVLGSQARSGDRELDDCSPNCGQQYIDRVKADYRLANVSLGVGAVGFITAALWYALSAKTPGAPRASGVTPHLEVGATPRGGNKFTLRLEGAF